MEKKYYKFRQNNSGGVFIAPAIVVYVEADNVNEANEIAERNGIYFDSSQDCECCGSRWDLAWETDATTVVDEEVSELTKMFAEMCRVPETLVISKT